MRRWARVRGRSEGGEIFEKGEKRARASRGGDRGARAAETPPRRETSPRGRSHAFDGIIERFDVDPRPARGGARSSRSLDRRAPCFFESPWANGGARARDPRLEAHLEHGLESIGHARHLAGVSTFVSDARSRGGGRAIGPIRRASKCAKATAAQPNFELRAWNRRFVAAER